MQTVLLGDGRRLAYAGWGRPDGTPVMYFHGALGSPLRRCSRTDAALRALGIRYLLVWRPGFGDSDPLPGRRLVDWPGDVDRMADALGIGRFAVLGVSTGGPYAAACAHALAERVTAAGIVSGFAPLAARGTLADMHSASAWGLRLVRSAPWLVESVGGAAVAFLRRRPDLLIRLLGLGKVAADRAHLADREARAIVVESFLRATERGLAGMVEDLRIVLAPWGFSPHQVRGPVQLWHGARDTTVPVHLAYRLAIDLPHCRAAFDPDEGHFFFRRRMTEILAALVAPKPGRDPAERLATGPPLAARR
jgi:pimeloyl-ACP methyl ester carboxylesterase